MSWPWKIYVMLTGFIVAIAGVAVVPLVVDNIHEKDGVIWKKKEYRRVIGEDVRVSRHGIYGVDFIRCGRCVVEKMRKGPLSFGAFNKLILEDLYVIIPPEEEKSPPSKMKVGISPHEIANRMGVSDGFLNSRNLPLKFSGLEIRRMEMARLDGTDAVTILSSSYANAKKDGLHLSNCGIIVGDSTNCVGEALLMFRPVLKVVWKDGSLELK